jgi:hypothetical protein
VGTVGGAGKEEMRDGFGGTTHLLGIAAYSVRSMTTSESLTLESVRAAFHRSIMALRAHLEKPPNFRANVIIADFLRPDVHGSCVAVCHHSKLLFKFLVGYFRLQTHSHGLGPWI